jgi:hypothetical protein
MKKKNYQNGKNVMHHIGINITLKKRYQTHTHTPNTHTHTHTHTPNTHTHTHTHTSNNIFPSRLNWKMQKLGRELSPYSRLNFE